MPSLNSPPGLTPLEVKILESIPPSARHCAIVGAGDGRLLQALREKLGQEAHFLVIEPRKVLHPYLESAGFSPSASPWSPAAYEKSAKRHGPFDALLILGLQSYWNGELYSLRRLLGLVSPQGLTWLSFVNAASVHFLEESLPPLRLGLDTLTDPTRLHPRLDFATWMAALAALRQQVKHVWGLLDEEAWRYCQTKGMKEVVWDVRGKKIKATTISEAYLWGSAYIGIGFSRLAPLAPGQARPAPEWSAVAYASALWQAFLDPYPEASSQDDELLQAAVEVELLEQQASAKPVGPLTEFLLQQVAAPDSVKSAALIGAGWGRDLLVLSRLRPDWRWSGVETSAEKIRLGSALLKKQGLKLTRFSPAEGLKQADKSVDVLLTQGYFSTIYPGLARHLAAELLRVAKQGIYHLEDSRGPEHSWKLKLYSLKKIYEDLGVKAELSPVVIRDQASGYYLLKVAL